MLRSQGFASGRETVRIAPLVSWVEVDCVGSVGMVSASAMVVSACWIVAAGIALSSGPGPILFRVSEVACEGESRIASSGIASRELGDNVIELDIERLTGGSASSSMASSMLGDRSAKIGEGMLAPAVNAESAVAGVVGVNGDRGSGVSLLDELLLKGGGEDGRYDRRCPTNLRLGARDFP